MSVILACDVYYVKSQHMAPRIQRDFDITQLDAVISELHRLQQKSQLEEALLLLRDAAAIHEIQPRFLLLRADILIEAHSERLALKDLNTLIKIQPQNIQALAMRARYFYDVDRMQEAKNDVAALLKAAPGNGAGLLLHGMLQFTDGSYSEAIATFTACLHKNDNTELVLYNRARCHVELNDFESARKDLKVVIEKSPGSAMAQAAEKAMQSWLQK
ncbi:MAG: tetratricopeptide repeat protein [Planctomycetes bacterium]|nr:tetratricopeptide repeat protein [Planctomycetota bacterium]